MKICVALLHHQPVEEQVRELKQLGYDHIIQIPHPNIPPEWEMDRVMELVGQTFERVAEQIAQLRPDWVLPDMVWCQGDFRFFYAVLQYCKPIRVPVYIATTQRQAQEQKMPDGSVRKVSVFKHVRFVRIV